MTGRRSMGAVDAIWLSMDSPDNLMVIDSVMMLEGPADWERLEAVVQHRLVDRYPVFTQRVVEASTPLSMPHWEDDEDFTLAGHLHRVELPAPADDAALQSFIEARMQEPMRRDRALWDLYLVDGHETGAVVVARFHHALADGIALAQVLLSLTDDEESDDLVAAARPAKVAAPAEPHPSGLLDVAGRLTRDLTSGVRGALHMFGEVPAALNPAHAIEALTVAWQTGQIADKLLLGHAPESPISGDPGVPKRAVWSLPRPLPDVKLVGRATGATVNDVLVGAVSGAIATYVEDRGGDPGDLTTMVPVNLRDGRQPLPRELGNKFALVMLPLPTGSLAPLERLAEAKRRMDSIKHSPEAVLTFGLITAIGHTNTEIAKHVIDFFAAKAIGVTTNVAGPMAGRYLAGTRISNILGWVPGSGRQTLGVCIFSYNGVVRVGFKADATVITDPENLVHAFDEEMDTLVRLAAAV
jgi:diacylglycerol O-acyltransferase / wax synthase